MAESPSILAIPGKQKQKKERIECKLGRETL
jgi:hypothetical protein